MKYCDNCRKIFDDALKFCPQCSTLLHGYIETPEENVCPSCGAATDKEQNFCNMCGCALIDGGKTNEITEKKVCRSCGNEMDGDENFCQRCGAAVYSVTNSDSYKQSSYVVKKAADSVKQNKFIASVREDLDQSRSIAMMKEKMGKAVNKMGKLNLNTKKIAVIAVVIIAIVTACIGLNFHTCDNCDKKYIGKQYSLSGGKMCKDCYQYYTVLEW